MNKKVMSLELSSENSRANGYYYATLELPATDYEIRDALQRIRHPNHVKMAADQISIYNNRHIPQLDGRRLDSPTIDELNFLAKRIAVMDENEIAIMQAIVPRFISEDESEIVSVKDLINITYGLQSVAVISNVTTDEELGQFVIDNDLQDDVSMMPEDMRHLLDKAAIGRIQRAADEGVNVGKLYVCAGHFEMPKVYDGKTLPEAPIEQWFAFRLKVSESPKGEKLTDGSAEWISLPTSDYEAKQLALRHNEASISKCVYYDFESSIPQITMEDFPMMADFEKLNNLAFRMAGMSPQEQITFKAALEAERPNGLTLEDMLEISNNLHRYEMSFGSDSADAFFKEYLLTHMDSKFDERWLNNLNCQRSGEQLLQRLGATVTDYGVISSKEGYLYKLVSCDEPEGHKTLSAQGLSDEQLDVIEVLDRKALFTNGRVLPEELPVGLYAYDLRMSDDHDRFASIEKSVMVNHGGTILLREALDFGESGSILLSPDDEPNFLGEEMTLNEFLKADLDEMFDQSQGGISQC